MLKPTGLHVSRSNLAIADGTQRYAGFATESNAAVVARYSDVARTIARGSDTRLMTRQFTLMMYTGPHAWSRADLTHSRAWASTPLVTAVQLTTGATRRTRLAARRLHTSDHMSQTSASENTNATWRIQ